MPKTVKIGRTAHSSMKRSKMLSGTATPEDFVVVYDELVSDCESVERRLHERFHYWRHRANREFFQIPVRDAVRGLIEESSGYVVPRIGTNEGVEMLPDLKRKYSAYLRPDFQSIKIVHRDGVVYLETIRLRSPGLRDEIVTAKVTSDVPRSRAPLYRYGGQQECALCPHQSSEAKWRVSGALASSILTHDVAAQSRYLSLFGLAALEHHAPEQALWFLNQAITTAEKNSKVVPIPGDGLFRESWSAYANEPI